MIFNHFFFVSSWRSNLHTEDKCWGYCYQPGGDMLTLLSRTSSRGIRLSSGLLPSFRWATQLFLYWCTDHGDLSVNFREAIEVSGAVRCIRGRDLVKAVEKGVSCVAGSIPGSCRRCTVLSFQVCYFPGWVRPSTYKNE